AGAEERVCLASFERSTIARARMLGYRGPTSLARAEVAQLLALPTLLQKGMLAPRGHAAQLPVSLAKRFVIDKCKRLGLRVDIWTVNTPSVAREVLALGVDGIMTDDPAAVAPTVRKAC